MKIEPTPLNYSSRESPPPGTIRGPPRRWQLETRWLAALAPKTPGARGAPIGAIYRAFCEQKDRAIFPNEPLTIRAVVKRCIGAAKKSTTIRRYAAVGLASPYASVPVRLAPKSMARAPCASAAGADTFWEHMK